MIKRFICAVVMSLFALKAQAQDWGNLDALLFQSLTRSGTAEASYWLPNAADPGTATAAIGVVYEHIAGSAGSVSIETGVFMRQANGWVLAGKVDGLYGHEPRNTVFSAGFVDITTTLPGPNDPRCCPTMPTRWRIDFGTMTAVRVQ